MMQERLDGAICPGWLPQPATSVFVFTESRAEERPSLPSAHWSTSETRAWLEEAAAFSADPQQQPPTDGASIWS